MKIAGLKTYSHLQDAKRVPSEYEIGSTSLHYYPKRGLEIETPVSEWVTNRQAKSALKLENWNAFVDPHGTTYMNYTSRQYEKVAYVSKLNEASDVPLAQAHRAELARTVGCLRFVCHALQMTAAYVGQMAPSSQLTIVCSFQAADEMRKVHQFSYRLALWGDEEAADQAMSAWLKDESWQPLRKLMEELLVTFDWTESFIALNRVVKCEVDRLLGILAQRANVASQFRFAEVVGSLLEDSEWHRDWSKKLECLFEAESAENMRAIEKIKTHWKLKAEVAVNAVITSWTLPEART